MSHREDPDFRAEVHEHDRIRKAREQRASNHEIGGQIKKMGERCG
jgi:hypothetical protein